MTTWQDLTLAEQAVLVMTVLSETYLFSVSHLAADRGTENPYIHLCALGLLRELNHGQGYVTFAITPDADELLLAAPDDLGVDHFFPLILDMAEMKNKLRGQVFRLQRIAAQPGQEQRTTSHLNEKQQTLLCSLVSELNTEVVQTLVFWQWNGYPKRRLVSLRPPTSKSGWKPLWMDADPLDVEAIIAAGFLTLLSDRHYRIEAEWIIEACK